MLYNPFSRFAPFPVLRVFLRSPLVIGTIPLKSKKIFANPIPKKFRTAVHSVNFMLGIFFHNVGNCSCNSMDEGRFRDAPSINFPLWLLKSRIIALVMCLQVFRLSPLLFSFVKIKTMVSLSSIVTPSTCRFKISVLTFW